MKLSNLKWFFLLLGAIKFNYLGAIYGFFFGMVLEYIILSLFSDNNVFAYKKNQLILTPYQKELLILIAAVLKEEPIVSQKKSYFILKYFYRQFGTQHGKWMYQKLKDILYKDINPIKSASVLKSLIGITGKHQVLSFLLGLAKQNGFFSESEYNLLQNIAMNMGMNAQEFKRVVGMHDQQKNFYNQQKNRNYTNSINQNEHFKTLGIKEEASVTEIKKAYRKLVLKYHPDSTKLDLDLAREKFQKIQIAYEQICIIKNIK